MEQTATYEKIATLLREVDEKLNTVTAESIRGKHLTQELALDSLDVIKFVLLVEERFGITIPDEEIDSKELLKVDNLASYVAAREA